MSERWRQFVKRTRDFVLYKILRADDPPYKLAMGVAVGVFVTFTPTMGVQMAFSAALAWILRANIAVGLPIVWISNPATMLFIYYPLYLLGTVLTGQESVGIQWFVDLFNPSLYPDGWWPEPWKCSCRCGSDPAWWPFRWPSRATTSPTA